MTVKQTFLLLLVGAATVRADGFYDFLTLLNLTPHEQRQALVDSFVNHLPGDEAPIKEDTLAHFVYSGIGNSMAIAGDMTYWNPDLLMINVASTDFWYRTFSCPRDSRIDYKFVRNGVEWLLDPLNPHTILGGYGPNSELAMPDYVQPPEVKDHGYPSCEITTYFEFYSQELDNTRTIKVITPPDYDPGGRYSTLIVHDGLEFITLGSIHNVLAYMSVHYPEVSLPICVCVPPVNRTEEYQTTQQEAFGRFITETVIPFVNENFATTPDDPDTWGSMGASNGGNVSLYLAGAFPELIHQLIVMSPYIPVEQYERIAVQPSETFSIYLNWGYYDLQLLIPLIDEFNAMLEDSGVVHYKKRFNEGHSWGLWRATIDEGLQFLHGGGVGVDIGDERTKPNSHILELHPYPNPFYDGVTLNIHGARGPVNVLVYDIAGRAHARARLTPGTLTWRWNPRSLPTARYMVRVTDQGESVATVPVLHLR